MVKIKVLGKSWSVILRSDKAHLKRFPDTHAVAILDDRKIHIRRSSLNMMTICHELIHSFQHELSYFELELDDEQTSEWFAELFAKYGEQIIKDARLICQQLA